MSKLTPHQGKALNTKAHLSLTANAGSGKTFVLVKRYLEIALSLNIPLKEIAAITFTEKAASELYKKIADSIDSEYNTTNDKTTKKKLENLRRQLISANISTIHSFCINILREFPVEADIDVNFSPIDETYSSELIELSVDETIKKLLKDVLTSEQTKSLIRVLGSYSGLSSMLTSLLKNRKNVLEVRDKIYSKSDDEITGYLDYKFTSLAERIIQPVKDKFVEAVKVVNEEAFNRGSDFASEIKQKLPGLNTGNIKEYLTKVAKIAPLILTGKGEVRKQKYLPGSIYGDYPDEIATIQDFFKTVQYLGTSDNDQQINTRLVKFGRDLLDLFSEALSLYSKKKKENSSLDFEDILLYVVKILSNEEVRNSLSEKFKFIMVDEYQDTNEVQYQIFLPILDYLNKNNLFVVGDEKQSIYMFRDAELEVFNRTKNDIAEKSGKNFLLTLPDSFRMSPAICAFTNFLFAKLFSNPDPLYNEVEYSPIVCAKTEELDGKIELILIPEESDADNEYEPESKLVAKRIIQLVNDETAKLKISWKDVAILCRKRKSFAQLEKEFTFSQIPFSVIGGKGFYQRQLVFDVYSYFSFLLNKEDDTALIAILRSPFFSLSDSMLYEISLEDGPYFYFKLKKYAETNPLIKKVYDQLSENLALANTYGIINLLRKITTESGYISVYSARQNGEQEFANYQKLVNLSATFIGNGYKNLYDYVNFLKDAIEKIEGEGQPVPLDDKDSVKIMTIHQAKGLEFKAVFLFNCHEKELSPKLKSKEIIVNKEFGILTKLPPGEDYFEEYIAPPIVKLNDFISLKKNSAELKRMFYVAVTRAKNYLFISGKVSTKSEPSGNSFIELLRSGLNFNPEAESFEINTTLKFLKKNEDAYFNTEENINLNIPVVKEIPALQVNLAETNELNQDYLFNLQRIGSMQSGEIISATKVSMFNQCPFKYKLTYELGFSSLFEKMKRWEQKEAVKHSQKQFEFTLKEDLQQEDTDSPDSSFFIKDYASIKGRIVHSALEKNVKPEELKSFVSNSLSNEFDNLEKQKLSITEIESEILNSLVAFYNSEPFTELNSFPNYKNEFEAYLFCRDYYLYGIIDKLILYENNAIIIDYKTDNIPEDKIEERWNNYFYQLMFYALIICELYPSIEKVELRLIFISHPDKKLSKILVKSDVVKFKPIVQGIVDDIRAGKFKKNLEHCKSCIFSTQNNRCIA